MNTNFSRKEIGTFQRSLTLATPVVREPVYMRVFDDHASVLAPGLVPSLNPGGRLRTTEEMFPFEIELVNAAPRQHDDDVLLDNLLGVIHER